MGDEVADSYRLVHVPEQWQRRERDRQTQIQVVRILGGVALAALFLSGAIGGIIRWSRRTFDTRVFLSFFVLLAVAGVLDMVNSWPQLTALLSTAQPFVLQVVILAGTGLVAALVASAAVALGIGFVQRRRDPEPPLSRRDCILLGVAMGSIGAGMLAAAGAFAPSLSPSWADYAPANSYVPLLQASLSPLTRFVQTSALLLLLFTAAERISNGWRKRKALLTISSLIMGAALAGMASVESLGAWVVGGLVSGIVLLAFYVFLVRFELALVPLAAGTLTALGELQGGLQQAYGAALPGAVVSAVLIAALAALWSGRIQRGILGSPAGVAEPPD